MNLIFIGMPTCGKSTVGVLVAKALGYDFIDTDLLIQNREKRKLGEIIAQEGMEAFSRIEEDVNASVHAEHTVIAPGGSVVYGKRAMEHFKKIGTIVYLHLSCPAVEARLKDARARGVVMKEGMTIEDLYEERRPLYEKYADLTIECDGRTMEEVVDLVLAAIKHS